MLSAVYDALKPGGSRADPRPEFPLLSSGAITTSSTTTWRSPRSPLPRRSNSRASMSSWRSRARCRSRSAAAFQAGRGWCGSICSYPGSGGSSAHSSFSSEGGLHDADASVRRICRLNPLVPRSTPSGLRLFVWGVWAIMTAGRAVIRGQVWKQSPCGRRVALCSVHDRRAACHGRATCGRSTMSTASPCPRSIQPRPEQTYPLRLPRGHGLECHRVGGAGIRHDPGRQEAARLDQAIRMPSFLLRSCSLGSSENLLWSFQVAFVTVGDSGERFPSDHRPASYPVGTSKLCPGGNLPSLATALSERRVWPSCHLLALWLGSAALLHLASGRPHAKRSESPHADFFYHFSY